MLTFGKQRHRALSPVQKKAWNFLWTNLNRLLYFVVPIKKRFLVAVHCQIIGISLLVTYFVTCFYGFGDARDWTP